ncbi:MAG: hypothetical protein ACMUIU_01685 [bacterium]
MKKKAFVVILSLSLFFCFFVIEAMAQYDTILPDGNDCLFITEIVATGQGGDISNIFIGIDSESYNYPYPPSPPPDFTVAMWIKGVGDDKYFEDIREPGFEEEVWRVEILVSGPIFGGTADINLPGFYPELNWDASTICPMDPDTGYSLKLYSEDEMGDLTLLIPDMSQTSHYQTKKEDAQECSTTQSYCSFVYYIAWSRPKVCIFTAEITATGQIITGNENNMSRVFIGIGYSESKIESPPFPPPDSTVVLNIRDGDENLTEYIREQGLGEQEWELIVTVANSKFDGASDPNYPGFFPVLSWNPNDFCPPDPNTGYFRLYSEDEQGNRTMLVPDMSQISQYQTKEEDGQCVSDIICTFTYYIVWSKDMEFEMNLPAGWSMISLPVVPLDARLSSVFPGAAVVYKFERKLGYVRVQPSEDLQIGAGYWALVYEDQNYRLIGQPINSYSKMVDGSGWEMIGGCTTGARPSTDNCDIGVIYRFVRGEGYKRVFPTEAMDPGKGFWILLKEVVDQCNLTVEAIGPLSRLRESSYVI